MDLKEPGNRLVVVGMTRDELGGSHYHLVTDQTGGVAPMPDLDQAPKIFAAMHRAITAGWVRSCHDLSEGGLAVAAAEMAFAGEIGVDINVLDELKCEPASLSDETLLFSESTSRFLVEVRHEHFSDFFDSFYRSGLPVSPIAWTVAEPRLRIEGPNGEWVIDISLAELKEAWQRPLRW